MSASRRSTRGRGGSRPPPQRNRTSAAPRAKMSTRYARILADEAYEAQIQATYSPPTVTNAATRTLSLRRQKERDGDAFRLPTLSQCCLNVAAKNFLTHVLPSQETFESVSASEASTKGKKRSYNATAAPEIKKARVIARGIGNRPIYDEETAAGDDFVPSDGEIDRDAEHVGIAAPSGRSSARTRQKSDVKSRAGHLSADDLKGLSQDNDQLLRMIPDRSAAKLLRLLRSHCPNALTGNILAAYFIAGRSDIELDASMTLLADSPQSIDSLIRKAAEGSPTAGPPPSLAHGPPLTRLSLSGMTRLSPQSLSALFRRCSQLEEVVIKGCVRIDAPCIEALLEKNADTLKIVNANFTDIGIQGVEAIISRARRLEVLKIANVLGLTDKAVPDMVRRALLRSSETKPPFVSLGKLKTLKVRGTELGIVGLNSFILACRASLENLDIGLTNLHSGDDAIMLGMSLGYGAPSLPEGDAPSRPSTQAKAPLRKLNLSSTFASPHGMERAVPWISQTSETLETLVWQNAKFTGVDFCRLTYWRRVFFPRLHRLSLSESLYIRYSHILALEQPNVDTVDTILHPGIEILDLSRTRLSIVQSWLLEAEQALHSFEQDSLETPRHFETKVLDLSETKASDEDLKFFAERCPALQKINLSATLVTGEAVRFLISKCRFLTSIDLTGCRGVPVRDRRRIFETMDAADGSEGSDAG